MAQATTFSPVGLPIRQSARLVEQKLAQQEPWQYDPQAPTPLLDLPAELRLLIWEAALSPIPSHDTDNMINFSAVPLPAWMRSCVMLEVAPIFYKENVFVS